MNRFKNKKILLSPHSPMTLALQKQLVDNNSNIIGFIDKNKTEKDIFKINQLKNINYDYIIILSPNHFDKIYQEYLKYIPQNIIYQANIKNNKYTFINNVTIYKREIKILPKDINIIRTKLVFISKDFISSNNKALYIYCIKNNINCTILTDNEIQIKELKRLNLPCTLLETDQADYEIAYAKFIIFDQGNYTYLPQLHKEQKTVQLWHGVGLKKMSKLTNIKYDYFISTSNWTNETNFKSVFLSHNFLNCGYPRNDNFKSISKDKLDTLFCDKYIYEFVRNKNEKKIILYMPTHRENSTKEPLNLETLNTKLININYYMIIKLHPFILKYYKSIEQKEYSNILFHNTQGDIYPILTYTDILISDYSSVIYDFLLLDKPIIFFIYDFKEYIKNTKLLFDYNEYSPGIKVQTQEELLNAIKQPDTFQEQRKIIRDKFFDTQNIDSSKKILDIISL